MIIAHGPSLWPNRSQSSWRHNQTFGFNSRRYQIFLEVVSVNRGPVSLAKITDDLLEMDWNRKVAGPIEKTEINGHRDPLL
jgi:hypothetical protein